MFGVEAGQWWRWRWLFLLLLLLLVLMLGAWIVIRLGHYLAGRGRNGSAYLTAPFGFMVILRAARPSSAAGNLVSGASATLFN